MRERDFNKISLTIVNDTNINWYAPLVFLRFSKSENMKLYIIISFINSEPKKKKRRIQINIGITNYTQ